MVRELEKEVICFLEANTRDEALVEMLSMLDLPMEAVLQSILQREQVVSTGIGIGIALPHAKMAGLTDFQVVIGLVKNREGIDWNAIDRLPVRIVLLICGPADAHGEYLQLLSRLTRLVKQEEIRTGLLEAVTIDDVVKILDQKKEV